MSVNLVDSDDPWPGFLGVTSGMSTTVWRARHKARWLAVGTTAGECLFVLAVGVQPKLAHTQNALHWSNVVSIEWLLT